MATQTVESPALGRANHVNDREASPVLNRQFQRSYVRRPGTNEPKHDREKGLAIFAPGFPVSSQIQCDASEPGVVIEETVNTGGSSLSYNATTDQYSYIWKTDKGWKGTRRMLIVRFNDSSQHLAKFRFK